MSDNQQRPDWWLASDGKWYPPQEPMAAVPTAAAAAPPYESPIAPATATARPPRWQTWQLVTASVLALVVGFGIGSVGSSDKSARLSASSPEALSSTTTAMPRTTTTAEPTTTTTTPPTTTAPPPTEPPTTTTPGATRQGFQTVFESTRGQVLSVLSSSEDVKSVDKFVYEQASGTVVLDLTSAWASPDNQAEGAWNIARAMGVLWEPNSGRWTTETFTPNFTFVNSGHRYACPSGLMLKLGATEASRSDFESACS